MMLTIFTLDWVPDFPRGFVRDMRARWVAEEIGRPYQTATVPLQPKSDAHRAMQPFGQVPIITDGDLTLFETGAIVLHLATGSALLPEARRPEITQWAFAALNSIEPPISGWMNAQLAEAQPQFFGPPYPPEVLAHLRQGMDAKLQPMEQLLADKDWIAGDFSAADILLADTLRLAGDRLEDYPVLTAYVARATARPAFQRAMDAQMAHWAAADAARMAASA